MKLNSVVEYLRYPFQLVQNNYQLTGLLMEKVYESKDFGNKAEFAFDEDFILIDDFYLENPSPTDNVIAITRTGYHMLIEMNGNTIKRYEQISQDPIAELIAGYSASFHKPEIAIKEGTLVQKTIPKPMVIVFSPESDDLREFEGMLNGYYSNKAILEEFDK